MLRAHDRHRSGADLSRDRSAGSLSAAARSRRTAQSTLSRLLDRLESQLRPSMSQFASAPSGIRA
jgi:hypothetical protein